MQFHTVLAKNWIHHQHFKVGWAERNVSWARSSSGKRQRSIIFRTQSSWLADTGTMLEMNSWWLRRDGSNKLTEMSKTLYQQKNVLPLFCSCITCNVTFQLAHTAKGVCNKELQEASSWAWFSCLVKISNGSTERWNTMMQCDSWTALGGTFMFCFSMRKGCLSLPPSQQGCAVLGLICCSCPFPAKVCYSVKPMQIRSSPRGSPWGILCLVGVYLPADFSPLWSVFITLEHGVAQLWMEGQNQADLWVSHQSTPWANPLKDSLGHKLRSQKNFNGFSIGLESLLAT